MRAIGIDKETLFDLYINKNWTREEVAKYFNCSVATIKKWIGIYKLPHKTIEAHQANIERCNLEKYGYKNVFQVPEKKDKIKATWVENYGSIEERYNQSVQKIIETNRKLYGVDWNTQTNEFCKIARKRYKYKTESFDSSWELAFYIWAEDHNEHIEHEPITLEFTYKNKKHYYTPDFRYNGMLIDIKGDQFLDKNGNLKLVYNTTNEEFLKVKNKFIKDSNIIFWTENDIMPYIVYVKNTYGNDYLKSFKEVI